MGCFTWIILFAGAVIVLMSVIRWFEQTSEAVDRGWWNKLAILVLAPFTVWFFPSRVSAGRATPVPRHEPVRGFGAAIPRASRDAASPPDEPPPGTPAEFLGLPAVPPPSQRKPRAPVDPEKLAKLKQKMREQGMLPPHDSAQP